MTLKSIITLGALIGLSSADVFFKETFSDKDWEKRWVQSKWKEDMGKFEWSSGKLWNVDPELEKGMQASEDAKFYGISSLFDKPISNKDQDLVLQFSVKNEGKSSSFCGGGYIKLLPSSLNQKTFGGESPYLIMFGPDICGYDVSRIHVIFNYDGKNLLKKEDIKLEYDDKNDLTHLYTLVVHPDSTYEVFFDQKSKAKGSLLDGWDFPQKTIPDPEDRKPSDWVDEEFIDDPEARKPDGWDDIPEMIPDSTAVKPEDWDEEDDGKWEAPLIKNPEFKGEWEPKRIPNPEFKGRWVQKTVSNPNYREDVYKYEDIGAVGYELWIVNKGSIFDNIFVGNSLEEAKKFADETFGKIKEKEKDAKDKYEVSKKTEEKVEEEDDDDDKETDSQEKEEL